MFENLRRDCARHYPPRERLSLFHKAWIVLDTPGIHGMIVFRFGHWVRGVRFRLVRWPLIVLHQLLNKLCIIFWGISIHPAARIAGGLYIGHWGGVIIGPIVMGQDCNIAHQVTIGVRVDGTGGVPSFGDNVWIGVGSVVYGDVTIGNGVTIGPYTVVSRSLPDRSMVLGNPLRVVSSDYDNFAAIYGRPRAAAL